MNLDFIFKTLGGLSWWRIGGGVLAGMLIIFAACYVWTDRPHEFYTQGKKDEAHACEERRSADALAASQKTNDAQKRRAKILARPHSAPGILLERMRRGEL